MSGPDTYLLFHVKLEKRLNPIFYFAMQEVEVIIPARGRADVADSSMTNTNYVILAMNEA